MNSGLRETPLHGRHVQLGAKTADFGGWDMPIEYSGVLVEHEAVRSAVGIFDVSHMGKVRIHGEGAAAFLNSVLTNDLDRIGEGCAQYTMLCNEYGGVVDDLIVYRWSDDEIFMVANPGARYQRRGGRGLLIGGPSVPVLLCPPSHARASR